MTLNSAPGPRWKPAIQASQELPAASQAPRKTMNDPDYAPPKSLEQQSVDELKKIGKPATRIMTNRWPGNSTQQSLTTAQTVPLLVSGNGNTITLQASSSGMVSIQLEQDNAPLIDLLPGQSIRQRNFSRFYLTWAAQAGGNASLLIETLNPGQEIV